MRRSTRKHLRRALRPTRHRDVRYATAVLLLPVAVTADEPHWSPGPGFVEISTASKWAIRRPDGTLHAVVRSTDRFSDQQVLITGDLSTADLLGLGGITDKPHRLRWMAKPGTLREEHLDELHPALRYERWCDDLQATAQQHLKRTGLPLGRGELVNVVRRPDGRYQLVFDCSAWTSCLDSHAFDISRALTTVARCYGAGARVTFHSGQADADVADPLYAHACQQLESSAVHVPAEDLIDRLTDLVGRATAAQQVPSAHSAASDRTVQP